MTVYRVMVDRFSAVPLSTVDDERLSYKALGLLTYLLSKPQGWKVRESDLISRHSDGPTSVRSGIKELRKYGYVRKVQIRKDGKISEWETFVYSVPFEEDLSKTQVAYENGDQIEEEVEDRDSNEDQENHRFVDDLPRCAKRTPTKRTPTKRTPIVRYISSKNKESNEPSCQRSRNGPGSHSKETPNGRRYNQPPPVNGFIPIEEMPIGEAPPGHSPFHEECGRQFKKTLEENSCICGNKTKRTLCEGFRLLELQDKRTPEDIKKLLLWWSQNRKKKFCPKNIYTSQQFRENWNRLWLAMENNAYEDLKPEVVEDEWERKNREYLEGVRQRAAERGGNG